MTDPLPAITRTRCRVCGTEFRPHRRQVRYCGAACRRESRSRIGRAIYVLPPLPEDADTGTPPPRTIMLDNWRDFSACRNHPELDWFSTLRHQQEQAQAICRECPVRIECLAEAIERCEMHGIWGGLTELELRERRGRTRLVQCAECGKRFEATNTGRNPATCSDPCHDSRTRKLNRARQAQVRR